MDEPKPMPFKADDGTIVQGAVTLGNDTLKSLLLINGAGAIGLLTFYGNVLKEGLAPNKNALLVSLICFSLGVGLAVIAAICGYLAQLGIAMNAQWNRSAWCGALFSGCMSVVLFFAGVIFAAISFP